MTRYILDTDSVTLFQYGNPQIVERARQVGGANLFVTTVTLEEQLRGRLAAISKASLKPERLVIAYANLRKTLTYFCQINWLDFDETAYNCYENLRQQKV